MPLYEDVKVELHDALVKREKFNRDMKSYYDMVKTNPLLQEQYGQYMGKMMQFPKFVLDEGIEEFKNKIKFYERIMELD